MSSSSARQRIAPQRIEPFWNRIPAFFRYALSPVPLILYAVVGAVTAILPFFAVLIIVYALMTKYAFEVLIQTSEGEMRPPGLTGDVLNEHYELVFKQIFIYVLFGGIVGGLASQGLVGLAGVVVVIGLFLQPAMTMVLASTNSFVAAVNPAMLVAMVVRVGWSYLALYGLLLVVYMGEENLMGFLLAHLGTRGQIATAMMISLFFAVLAYHMMGYLLYEHHEDFGIEQRAKTASTDEGTEARLGLFYSYMDRGLTDAAKAELLSLAAEDPADNKLQRKVCALLMTSGSETEKLRYARSIIPVLLESGGVGMAAAVYRDLVAGNPDFALRKPGLYRALANALNAVGEHKLAVSLTRNLHKRFLNDNEVAEIYLDAAMVLSDKLDRDDLAIRLLDFVVANYANHPRCNEAFQLATALRDAAVK
ncbi:MAG: hypothetical protein KDG50_02055 [Chromatiales bacterium]|nr:hypothetical protein [Chromatiales bacterium]